MNPTSIARTATRTGTQIYTGREKVAIFACEYYFKPQGVVAVTERFKRVLNEKNLADAAECQWSTGECFWRIACTGDADTIYGEFIKVVRGIIRQGGWNDYYSDSDADDEDMDGSVISFDSNDNEVYRSYTSIVRLSIWRRKDGNMDESIGDGESTVATRGKANSRSDSNNPDPASEFPGDIIFYQARAIWEHKESHLSLDEAVSDADLKEIAKLSDCQCIKNQNQQRIYIGSDVGEKVQRAVRKLNNVKKQAEWAPNYIDFVFYTEELQDIKLQLKYFTSVKEGYFKTTLLDNLLRSMVNDYSNLNVAATVRRADHDSLKAIYVVKKVPKNQPVAADSELNDLPFWDNFTYNEKGNSDLLNHIPLLPPKKEPPQNPEASLDSELQSNTVTNETVHGWARGVPPSAVVEIANEADIEVPTVQAPDAPAIITESFFTNPHIVPKKGNWDLVVEYGHEEVTQHKKNVYKPSYTPAGLAAKAESMLSRKFPPRTLQQRPAVPATAFVVADSNATVVQQSPPQAQFSLLDDDIPVRIMSQRFTSLQPMPRSVSLPLMLPSRARDPQVENGNLIDFDSEVLQVNNEVASREFYNTMKQMAPRRTRNGINGKQNTYPGRLELPTPPGAVPARRTPPHLRANLQDPLPEFLTQLNHKFEVMMKGAQGFRGEISLHVEFGRLIIKNVHEKHLEENKDPDKMSNLLKSGLLTCFTNILTVVPADISYLLELKNGDMWKGKHVEVHAWGSFYEFHCRNTGRPGYNPFKIEIDTETFAVKIKTKQTIGEINVFGTKRHWDFRLIALGITDCWEIEESYRVLAKAIESSLYIEPNNSLPQIYFKLDNSLIGDNKLEVDGIRVHRIREYLSRNSKSVLKISEIRELNIGKQPSEGEDASVYRAKTSSGSLWHTVTISSVEADRQLLENQTLELGDEASWTTASLAAVDAAPAMYLPAIEMLKRMDGVGYHNDNRIDPSAAALPETIQPEPVKFEFW